MSDIDKTTGEGITPPWGDTPPADLDPRTAIEIEAARRAGLPKASEVLPTDDLSGLDPVSRFAIEHPEGGDPFMRVEDE